MLSCHLASGQDAENNQSLTKGSIPARRKKLQGLRIGFEVLEPLSPSPFLSVCWAVAGGLPGEAQESVSGCQWLQVLDTSRRQLLGLHPGPGQLSPLTRGHVWWHLHVQERLTSPWWPCGGDSPGATCRGR